MHQRQKRWVEYRQRHFSDSSGFPSSHIHHVLHQTALLAACPLQASAPQGEKFLLAYCLFLTGTLLCIPEAQNVAFSSCLTPWQQAMVTAFLVVKGKRLLTFLSLKPFVCNQHCDPPFPPVRKQGSTDLHSKLQGLLGITTMRPLVLSAQFKPNCSLNTVFQVVPITSSVSQFCFLSLLDLFFI